MSEASATPRNSNKFIGLDGCSGGWVMAIFEAEAGSLFLQYFSKIFEGFPHFRQAASIWVDMPIGLSGGGILRMIDYTMRTHLRWRKSSVFFPPSYEALGKASYEEANRIQKLLYGKGLSKQAWNLKGKICELMEFSKKHPEISKKIFESHPELAFQSLWPHDYPLAGKSTFLGYSQRLRLLEAFVPEIQEHVEAFTKKYSSAILKKHDVLDAVVLAVKAAAGTPHQLKQHPDHDKEGFRFLVVY